MKVLKTAFRLLRLGFFVGAGASLTVLQACSATTRRDADVTQPPEVDADRAQQDADQPQQDADPPPPDADEDDDRWDVPLE